MANKKYTKQSINEEIKNRNIILIGLYKNTIQISKFKCLICGKTWETSAKNVLNGSGCSRCSGKEKLTNDIVDFKLKNENRSIIRIGNVIDGQEKTDFKCLICDYIWSASPSAVLHKTGCIKCANVIQLTNELIDEKLFLNNRTIKRIGNLIGNNKSKLNFQCNNCEHVWPASPHDIFDGTGCPQCAKYFISMAETAWLDYLSIPKELRQIQIIINNKVYIVDALDSITNTIYEFYGDYWHGNPKIYNSNDINKKNKISFGELYKQTINRENKLKDAGYNLTVIWELDWLTIAKNNNIKYKFVRKNKLKKEIYKEVNSKLTSQEIYNQTPLKFCRGNCQKDIESSKFYINMTKSDGLNNICKDCHKAKMATVRKRNKNKVKAAE